MAQRRGSIVVALILIVIGAWYFAAQFVPQVNAIAYGSNTWPYQIMGVGVLLALIALVAWVPGLFVPAAIVGGIGGLLYYQNMTGDWASWAYAWTLIPGFVGVGLILAGLFSRRRGEILGGLWNIFSSLILFGIFGWAFGGFRLAGIAWPAALILIGLLLLFRPRRERHSRHIDTPPWASTPPPPPVNNEHRPEPEPWIREEKQNPGDQSQ